LKKKKSNNLQLVRLSFQPLIFSQPTVFFSHNKSTNSTFNRLFSAKRTRCKNASNTNIKEINNVQARTLKFWEKITGGGLGVALHNLG
jgi:hypothetical protein